MWGQLVEQDRTLFFKLIGSKMYTPFVQAHPHGRGALWLHANHPRLVRACQLGGGGHAGQEAAATAAAHDDVNVGHVLKHLQPRAGVCVCVSV